jgi:hypothetical protein
MAMHYKCRTCGTMGWSPGYDCRCHDPQWYEVKTEPVAKTLHSLGERDKLWCAALLNTLDIKDVIEVLKTFNETRPD